MRWLIVLVVMARAASASTVVVLADAERTNALQLALSGRGVTIASAPVPEGELWLDRAAEAQRAAMAANADAAVWIDGDELSVVSADGRTFRHAPLGDESPRVFAAIATSLIDEMVAPPESFDIDVQIEMAPPGAVAPAAPPPAPSDVVRANRTLLEIGPMLSPFTAGLEAEIAFPVGHGTRVGVSAGGSAILWDDKHEALWLAAAELRFVGTGTVHNDWGPVGGGGIIDGGPLAYVGVRLSRVWEHASTGTSISLVPVIATNGKDTIPGVYGAIRWELPL